MIHRRYFLLITPIIFYTLCLISIIAATVAAAVDSSKPGARLLLTSRGLDQSAKVLLPIIAAAAKAAPIPDFKGVYHVPEIGDVDYAFTSIRITKFETQNAHLRMEEPNIFQFDEDGGSIRLALGLNWQYHQRSVPHLSGHGNATAEAQKSQLSLGIALSVVNGKPFVKSAAPVALHVGELNIRIEGGISGWLANLIAELLRSQVTAQVEKTVKLMIEDFVNHGANDLIQQQSFLFPLSTAFLFDATSPEQPLVTKGQYFTYGIQASVIDAKSKSQPPMTSEELPRMPVAPERHVNFYISAHPLVSFLYAAMLQGYFDQQISPDMVPEWSPIQLNTTSLARDLPELFEAFPDRKIVLRTLVDKPPRGVITQEGVSLMINGTLQMLIVNTDGSLTKAIDWGIIVFPVITKINASSVQDGRAIQAFAAIATPLGFDMRVSQSFIGPLDGKAFMSKCKFFFSIAAAMANKQMAQGYVTALPAGITISNLQVTLDDWFAAISFDFDHTGAKIAEDNIQRWLEGSIKRVQRLLSVQ